ncbi:hypothetical protein [Aureliella helgolandensis]|uniref:hypothetical protein n=1 Tax=Aureliella helgolandensis TaxID=2527968 RepID=UPI0018D15D55|nr:hypothetical protein [Aureliella helgolandensis]
MNQAFVPDSTGEDLFASSQSDTLFKTAPYVTRWPASIPSPACQRVAYAQQGADNLEPI